MCLTTNRGMLDGSQYSSLFRNHPETRRTGIICLAGQPLQGPRGMARGYAQDGAGGLPRVPLLGYRLLPAL
jgi:hypothetical protein